ncbi:ankyrin-1-like [Agrilus planipennis]|uniref:Ankyrin-1-like n=1 Tax=Agrilus planipennis TaxID=224129 RepID=A0A1W4XIJ1_AGRPL|nr:ankyrin-1-like [Agrilus planipennis]
MSISKNKADTLVENEGESNDELVIAASSKACRGQAKEILESEGEEELINFFFISVQFGNLRAVNDCLNCGISPNIRQADTTNALHVAAEQGNLNMGRLLLTREETDIHMKTNKGYTPLHMACYFGKKTFVELLLSNNANPNCETLNNRTPLHIATIRQNYEILSLLLGNSANPNVLDSFCDTPLSNCIIRKPNFKMAALLIVDYKADTNLHCEKHMHIILNLAQSCHTQNELKFVQLLIDNGVDYHATHPITNKNALHFAAMTGYEPIISLLLEYGVSTTQRDVWNRTPLQVAEQHGNENAIDLLLAYETLQFPNKL